MKRWAGNSFVRVCWPRCLLRRWPEAGPRRGAAEMYSPHRHRGGMTKAVGNANFRPERLPIPMNEEEAISARPQPAWDLAPARPGGTKLKSRASKAGFRRRLHPEKYIRSRGRSASRAVPYAGLSAAGLLDQYPPPGRRRPSGWG